MLRGNWAEADRRGGKTKKRQSRLKLMKKKGESWRRAHFAGPSLFYGVEFKNLAFRCSLLRKRIYQSRNVTRGICNNGKKLKRARPLRRKVRFLGRKHLGSRYTICARRQWFGTILRTDQSWDADDCFLTAPVGGCSWSCWRPFPRYALSRPMAGLAVSRPGTQSPAAKGGTSLRESCAYE